MIYSYIIIYYECGRCLLQSTWSRKDVNEAFFKQLKEDTGLEALLITGNFGHLDIC